MSKWVKAPAQSPFIRLATQPEALPSIFIGSAGYVWVLLTAWGVVPWRPSTHLDTVHVQCSNGQAMANCAQVLILASSVSMVHHFSSHSVMASAKFRTTGRYLSTQAV